MKLHFKVKMVKYWYKSGQALIHCPDLDILLPLFDLKI